MQHKSYFWWLLACVVGLGIYFFPKLERFAGSSRQVIQTGAGKKFSTPEDPLTVGARENTQLFNLSRVDRKNIFRKFEAGVNSSVPKLPAIGDDAPSKTRAKNRLLKRVDDAEAQKIREETKIMVASIYGAQRNFYLRHGRYTTDLKIIGWNPDARFNSERIGFLTPFFPKHILEGENPKFMSTDDFLQLEERERGIKIEYSDTAKDISLKSLRGYCQARCTASESYFEVVGAANLDSDADLEVWSINSKKQIVQLFDDLKK